MNTNRLFLLLNAALYIVFGLWCALAPEWTAQAVGLNFPGAQGFAEYVAVYGGLEFGVGIFFLLTATQLDLQRAGILFAACFYGGIALFRTGAILLHSADIGAGMNFYIAEVCFAVWSMWLVSQRRAV
jgi:hypothetical protein